MPLCSIVTGDFNAHNSRWWKNDITNFQGQELDSLTSSAGYTQMIDKPTYVIKNYKSCIDLIFCTNQNVLSIMVSMFQFLTNAIITSFLERLIFVFLFLQYIFEKCGTIKQQILKILKRQL